MKARNILMAILAVFVLTAPVEARAQVLEISFDANISSTLPDPFPFPLAEPFQVQVYVFDFAIPPDGNVVLEPDSGLLAYRVRFVPYTTFTSFDHIDLNGQGPPRLTLEDGEVTRFNMSAETDVVWGSVPLRTSMNSISNETGFKINIDNTEGLEPLLPAANLVINGSFNVSLSRIEEVEENPVLPPDPPPVVPEPATWAMMLIGFGLMATRLKTARRRV